MPTVERTAASFRIRGLVQSVGFRPFVYRLAHELSLVGWVCNDSAGVLIHAEGSEDDLVRFEQRLRTNAPPAARIASITRQEAASNGYDTFRVTISRREPAPGEALRVPPDRALCLACRRDIFDPCDRRYVYPFTTCTDCGPRYSILRSLPYDRSFTSMDVFPMCTACRAEYEDPLCRRFHAEPIACPDCGPQVLLYERPGQPLARRDQAIRAAAAHLSAGRIVALKGLGGFQLLVRADADEAVARLRSARFAPPSPWP